MTHLCCKKLRPSQCLGVCVCVILKSVYVRLMRTWQRVFVSARVHFVSLVCIWSIYLCFRVRITFRYPDYEFISDNSISWSAGLHNRYTENSLRGVILDIHFLSQTDFLVCTFSSQVSSRFSSSFLERARNGVFDMFSHETEGQDGFDVGMKAARSNSESWLECWCFQTRRQESKYGWCGVKINLVICQDVLLTIFQVFSSLRIKVLFITCVKAALLIRPAAFLLSASYVSPL